MTKKYKAPKRDKRGAQRLASLLTALSSMGELTLEEEAELEAECVAPYTEGYREMADACAEPMPRIYDAEKLVAFFKKRGEKDNIGN